MQQRTEAWRQWRAEGIGASLAPGVMDVNPWFPRTPYEVFLLLTKRVESPPETTAMRRGLALEAAARRAFEAETGLLVEPCTREHPEHPFLRASLDGITLDGTEIVELKVPGRETFEAIRRARELPLHYYWQVQQQLAVSRAARCHLWLYSPDEDGVLLPVLPRPDDIARLLTAAQALWRCVQSDTAPPLTDRDTVVRTDPEWLGVAAEYRQAEAVVAEWTPVLDRARRALITLMHGAARVEGGGVVATRFARQGAVDYKAIVQARLPDVDVAPYRRPGGEQVRITVPAQRTVAGPDPGLDGTRG
jgi:putative phage-type endonuclease